MVYVMEIWPFFTFLVKMVQQYRQVIPENCEKMKNEGYSEKKQATPDLFERIIFY